MATKLSAEGIIKAQKTLTMIRRHPALWGDLGPEKEDQAMRIRDACIARLRPFWQERADAAQHARGQRVLNTWA